MKCLKIALIGLNGYGTNLLTELLKMHGKAQYEVAAVITRRVEQNKHYDTLQTLGIGIYPSLKEALNHTVLDLVIIATPMHIHYQDVVQALKNNIHVLCEKPLAPTIDECIEIERLSKETGQVVAVGYQWSYSQAIQALKEDLLSERYGKLKRLSTLANWSRPKAYFNESNWKGRYKGVEGNYILENVMSNGAAHFLHNLLFLSGKTMNTSGLPLSMYGELYRAHQVEGFDTVCLKMILPDDVEAFYIATLVSDEARLTCFKIECEKGTIVYDDQTNQIVAHTLAGEKLPYGNPDEERFSYYNRVLDAIARGEMPICSVSTTLPSVIVTNAVIEKIPMGQINPSYIEEDSEGVKVKGIGEALRRCYEAHRMLSACDEGYKTKSQTVEIGCYQHFEGIFEGE